MAASANDLYCSNLATVLCIAHTVCVQSSHANSDLGARSTITKMNAVGDFEDSDDYERVAAPPPAIVQEEVVTGVTSKNGLLSNTRSLCCTSMRWVRRVTIEPALLLVMVSMGLTGSVSIQYVRHRINTNYNLSDFYPSCGETSNVTDAERAAASDLNGFNVISGLAGGIPAMVVTAVVSAVSDRVGRKLPLLLPVVGMACGTSAFLAVSLFELPLMVILVCNAIVSFSGGYALFFAGCSSYIADITAKKDRTTRFALLFTLALVGSGIAGVGAGYWIKASGYNPPFYMALGLQIFIIVYLIFWVSETITSTKPLHGDDEDVTNPGKPSRMSAILKGVSGIVEVCKRGRRLWMLLALTVLFVVMAVFAAISSILVVRLLSKPFCWNSVLIGYFNASKPFINGLGLTLGSYYLTKCLKDYAVIQTGLLSTAAMLVVICLSTETVGMFLVNIVGFLHALPPVILMAKMSKIVEPSLQGALFSLTGTTESLANLFGPFLLGMVYQGTLNTFPLAAFLVMIGLTVFTMIITGLLMIIESRNEMAYRQLDDTSGLEDNTG